MSQEVYQFSAEVLQESVPESGGGPPPPLAGMRVYNYGLEFLVIEADDPTIEEDASNEITFVATASATVDRYASAESILTLGAAASGFVPGQAADNEIEFDVVASAYVSHNVSATSDLNLVAVGTGTRRMPPILVSAQSHLALVQTVRVSPVIVAAQNLLSLVAEATAGQARNAEATTDFNLNVTAEGRTLNVSASSFIGLSAFADGDLIGKHRTASSILALAVSAYAGQGKAASARSDLTSWNLQASAVASGTLRHSASSAFNFNATVDKRQSFNRSASSALGLMQRLRRAKTASASSDLGLTVSSERRFPASSVLNLSVFALAAVGRAPHSHINFLSTASRIMVYRRSASNALALRVAAAAWIDRRSRCTPGIYSGTGIAFSIEANDPRTDVTLNDGVTTISLPLPELQDLQRLEWDRVLRTSRGGELQVFIDPAWPKNRIFAISWNNLSNAKKAELQTFLRDTLGLPLTYTHYDNQEYTVIVRNPMTDFTQLNRCRWAARLELEA